MSADTPARMKARSLVMDDHLVAMAAAQRGCGFDRSLCTPWVKLVTRFASIAAVATLPGDER